MNLLSWVNLSIMWAKFVITMWYYEIIILGFTKNIEFTLWEFGFPLLWDVVKLKLLHENASYFMHLLTCAALF